MDGAQCNGEGLWDKKQRLGCARCDGAVEVAKEMRGENGRL